MRKKIYIILIMWLLLLVDFNGLQLMTAAVLIVMCNTSFFRGAVKQFLLGTYTIQLLHILVVKAYVAVYFAGNAALIMLCDTSVSSNVIQAGMNIFDSMWKIRPSYCLVINILTVVGYIVLSIMLFRKKQVTLDVAPKCKGA